MKKYVLVLGSKPDSKLPDVSVEKIYSGNGAAERATMYKKKYPNTKHIAVITAKEFNENSHVSSRVIESNPEKMVVTMGKIDISEKLTNTKEILYLNQKERFNFQSKFYQMGKLDLIFGEIFFYENKFLKILKHIYMCVKYRGFLGGTTGLYCVLMAAFENPDSDIIVSGIGLVEGAHFYESEDSYGFLSKKTKELIENKESILENKFRNTSRCRVERFLVKRIKNQYKNRILSTDDTMVYHGKLNKWKGNLF